jgi:uncharacterized membrane protein
MPSVPGLPKMTSEIPEKTPPAIVDYLLNSRQVSVGSLIGTLLDLAARGFARLREERVEKKSLWGGMKEKAEYHWDLDRPYWRDHRGDLLAYENSLLEFIFDDLADGQDSISLEDVKKKRSEFRKFFSRWRKAVTEQAEKRQWFNRKSIRGFHYSLALGGVMMALGALSAFLFGIWGIGLLVAGGAIMMLSLLIPHRTAQGETYARQWMAVRRYLKAFEFRKADRSDLLAQISDYLVYGVVLGLSTKIYEQLASLLPEGQQSTYVAWYVYSGGRGGFSPAAFGSAFSSMIQTATSSMSTASGAGGGASAGGGGGAGSGGGGAG